MNDKNSKPESPKSEVAATDAAMAEPIGGAAVADAGASDSDKASAELEQLREELEEARDRNLRMLAELDNYRKRARREIEEERRYAQLPLLQDLLPVVDNVGRAIAAADRAADPVTLVDGFKMVAQQLENILTKHHCVRIPAQGAPFDPHLHQAIMQQPTKDHPTNTVVQVAQEGYQLHDRVLRPAQVVVTTQPPVSGSSTPTK